ncbi:hypothetical protein YC2023_115234 [Brassica napus]
MNCARAGVENQDGCEIRITSGTQNHHVMEKGMRSKKYEPLERSSKGVGTKRKVERRTISCLFRHQNSRTR